MTFKCTRESNTYTFSNGTEDIYVTYESKSKDIEVYMRDIADAIVFDNPQELYEFAVAVKEKLGNTEQEAVTKGDNIYPDTEKEPEYNMFKGIVLEKGIKEHLKVILDTSALMSERSYSLMKAFDWECDNFPYKNDSIRNGEFWNYEYEWLERGNELSSEAAKYLKMFLKHIEESE